MHNHCDLECAFKVIQGQYETQSKVPPGQLFVATFIHCMEHRAVSLKQPSLICWRFMQNATCTVRCWRESRWRRRARNC